LKNTINDVGITLGEALTPMLVGLVEDLEPIITTIGDWIERNPELAITLGKVGLAVGAITLALGFLTPAIKAAGIAYKVALGPIGLL
jgi:hypothetical protein